MDLNDIVIPDSLNDYELRKVAAILIVKESNYLLTSSILRFCAALMEGSEKNLPLTGVPKELIRVFESQTNMREKLLLLLGQVILVGPESEKKDKKIQRINKFLKDHAYAVSHMFGDAEFC